MARTLALLAAAFQLDKLPRYAGRLLQLAFLRSTLSRPGTALDRRVHARIGLCLLG